MNTPLLLGAGDGATGEWGDTAVAVDGDAAGSAEAGMGTGTGPTGRAKGASSGSRMRRRRSERGAKASGTGAAAASASVSYTNERPAERGLSLAADDGVMRRSGGRLFLAPGVDAEASGVLAPVALEVAATVSDVATAGSAPKAPGVLRRTSTDCCGPYIADAPAALLGHAAGAAAP